MLPSGLPEVIEDDEDIARFLTQSSHFKRDRVNPSAFIPGKRDRETSVSRHGRTPIAALCSLGRAAAGQRKLYGAAMIKAADVSSAELSIAADEPPDRHAVIKGWLWLGNDPALEKAQQKERALILASMAGPPLLF